MSNQKVNHLIFKSLSKGYFFNYLLISCLCLICISFNALDADQKERPNILFLAVDDLNDWVGYLKGHPQSKTPNIDKLAGESFAFTRAYCSAPLCGPSRTSLMYGIYPHRTGVYYHHKTYLPKKLISPDRLPLQLAFQKNGYHTIGNGKIYHGSYHDSRGWNTFVPAKYKDKTRKEITSVFGEDAGRPLKDFRVGVSAADPDSDELDGAIVNWAIDQFQLKHKKPFFMAIGLVKPHAPWIAPKKFYDQFDLDNIQFPETPKGDLDDIPAAGKFMAQTVYPFFDKNEHEIIKTKEDIWRKLVHAYLATSSHADYNVGRILKALETGGNKAGKMGTLRYGERSYGTKQSSLKNAEKGKRT